MCGDPYCASCFVQPVACLLCGKMKAPECERCGDETPCAGCPCDCSCPPDKVAALLAVLMAKEDAALAAGQDLNEEWD